MRRIVSSRLSSVSRGTGLKPAEWKALSTTRWVDDPLVLKIRGAVINCSQVRYSSAASTLVMPDMAAARGID